jgi:hypothetical protein
MRRSKVKTRIWKLLDELKARCVADNETIEPQMKEQYGIDEKVELVIRAPEKLLLVPSFDVNHAFELTPMLKARFEFASEWNDDGDIWLALADMRTWMKRRTVRNYHKALRTNCPDSAPALLPDHQLSLFGVSEDLPEYVTYLAWDRPKDEPRICSYQDLETYEFPNLEAYLRWCVERE